MLKRNTWPLFFVSFTFLLLTIYIRTDYRASVQEETYYRVALFIAIVAIFLYYKYDIYTPHMGL